MTQGWPKRPTTNPATHTSACRPPRTSRRPAGFMVLLEASARPHSPRARSLRQDGGACATPPRLQFVRSIVRRTNQATFSSANRSSRRFSRASSTAGFAKLEGGRHLRTLARNAAAERCSRQHGSVDCRQDANQRTSNIPNGANGRERQHGTQDQGLTLRPRSYPPHVMCMYLWTVLYTKIHSYTIMPMSVQCSEAQLVETAASLSSSCVPARPRNKSWVWREGQTCVGQLGAPCCSP